MTDIREILRRDLIPEQRAAATDSAAEVLCLACAGSGKSRTLAYRIAWLLDQGADPKSIVAFTFTEKAASSIKLRVAEALEATGKNPTALGAMYIGTIHAYCHHLLGTMEARYRQFDVLDDNRLTLYLVSRYSDLGIYSLREAWGTGGRPAGYFRTIEGVANAWKTANEERVNIEDVSKRDALLGEVLERLKERLDEDHFIDFSLMVRLATEALERSADRSLQGIAHLAHLMVDEYQDVNTVQEALIRELHLRSDTLFVVGDDDQAIYAWRGADVGNILTFERRHPACSVHTLPHNFRSTKAIVESADAFAAEELGSGRIAKAPTADNPGGPRDLRVLWFESREDEAQWVAARIGALLGTRYRSRDGSSRGLVPSDFAILMRSVRSRSKGIARHQAFTDELAARGISFTLEAGGGLFDRPQVAAMRGTLELLRKGQPDRRSVQAHFDSVITASFPEADFDGLTAVLSDWGRRVHVPQGGARQRLYPQTLVHELLSVFGIPSAEPPEAAMFDLGVFSRIIQDVESVYLSVDSAGRFGELLNFLSNVAEKGYSAGGDELLRRPEAVTVSTVHKMKGLEFPVVFVVDVEANRFPGTRRSYQGRLPRELIGEALTRGAYQSTPEEEARLFYTALTRAERYLYVSGASDLPGLVRPAKQSSFALRLKHSEMSDEPEGLPPGLGREEQRPRIDERVVPTSYSEVRYYLRCPRDYRFRVAYGFSPAITEMFGFGQTVHSTIGRLHQEWEDSIPTPEEAAELAARNFHLKYVPKSKDPENRPGGYERGRERAEQMAAEYARDYSGDFRQQRQVEVRFEIPVSQAVISGAIDLLLRTDDSGEIVDATVIDFKALEGGPDPVGENELDWTELALQVQLYAKAATDVLGENARTGAVHLLKDGQRVEVPVDDAAVEAATANVEWAVSRIIEGDFPRRPHPEKCGACDFRLLCDQRHQEFQRREVPPPLHLPGGGQQMARAFSELRSSDR